MNLLAFDTSTIACTIALQWQGEVTSEHHVAPREHHRLLLAGIQTLAGDYLNRRQHSSSLQAIICGIGPGSFVGTRMAVGVAQGLALGRGMKIIPVSTLQTIAQGVYREYGHTKVMLAQDAHMQKAYVGFFELKDGLMQPCQPEQLVPIDTLQLKSGYVAVGDAWKTTDAITFLPHAQDLLALAPLFQPVDPAHVFPAYLDDAGFWKKTG